MLIYICHITNAEEKKALLVLLIAFLSLLIILISFLKAIFKLIKKNNKLFLAKLEAELTAKEQERERIAKDLHDEIGSALTGINMYLQGLEVKGDRNIILLGKAKKSIQESFTQLNQIMNDLYPATLAKYGLEKSLVEMFDAIHVTGLLHIVYLNEINQIDEYFENTHKIHIFRIVREIVTNTIKHANSKTLSVRFSKKKDLIILETSDNGIGYENKSPQHTHGRGLQNILNRVEIINAEIFLETEQNKGVQYTIEIPIANEKG